MNVALRACVELCVCVCVRVRHTIKRTRLCLSLSSPARLTRYINASDPLEHAVVL